MPALSQALTGARRLVRRHLQALSLLAALTTAGQVAVQIALRAPQADAVVQARNSSQSAFSRHLMLCAAALQSASTPAQRDSYAADLRTTADDWKQSSPVTQSHDAATAQAAMLTSAHALLAALPPDSSAQTADLSPYLTPLLQDGKVYETAMTAAAAEDSRAAAAHLAALRWLQAGVFVVTLAALCLLALSATAGAAGRIADTLDALEVKKSETDAALGEADRQIAQMRQTLESLTTVDALTGLKNHRAFQEQLDGELGRALRHGHPLSLLLLDIDRFKSYNDSYSHEEGDRALKLFADLLKETLRVSDLPARYGGKEFAIIMPDTDMMGAVVFGERLRQAVASADGLQRPLTASIGIATLTPSIFSPAALIAQADRALCHAKGDGRNRVSHAHRIPAPLEDEAPVYARAA